MTRAEFSRQVGYLDDEHRWVVFGGQPRLRIVFAIGMPEALEEFNKMAIVADATVVDGGCESCEYGYTIEVTPAVDVA